jgi:hypothetical protein
MRIEVKCPDYEKDEEDGGHLFFKCKMVKDIWGFLNLERERVALADTLQVRDAIEFILKTKEDWRILMITALWFTWTEQNLIREEGWRRSAEFIEWCIR